MNTSANTNNIESNNVTRRAASKNTRKALCDELCALLGYKAWEIKKDACTGKFAGSYDYSLKFEDGKELYICTRKDLFETNVTELIDGFKRTSKEGYKHGDMVKTKNSGRVAKVMRVGTVCDGYGTMLYLKEEGVAPKDNRFVEIHNLICSADEVEPLQPASEISEAEGVKVGDKVRHNKHEEVATVTAIREAFVNRADGYRYLYTLDFGQSVLGPFQVELNGGEFLREAFTLYNPSEITGVYVSVCDGIVQDVFPNKDMAIQDMRRHVVNTLVGCCGGVIKSETETRWEVDFAAKNRREVCEVVRFDPNNEEHRKAYNAERSIWHLPELAPLESMSEIKRFGKMFIYRLYIKWKWMQQRFERIGDMDRAAYCFYHRLRLTKLYIYQPGWRIMDYGDMKPIFFPRQRIK